MHSRGFHAERASGAEGRGSHAHEQGVWLLWWARPQLDMPVFFPQARECVVEIGRRSNRELKRLPPSFLGPSLAPWKIPELAPSA